jgi:extracellular elastinolytic metalloproteinase
MRVPRVLAVSLFVFTCFAIPLSGANFDGRDRLPADFEPTIEQKMAEAALRRSIPHVRVSYDRRMRVTHSVLNIGGVLTAANGTCNCEPVEKALRWAREHLDLLGLVPNDLAEYEVTDLVPSDVSGTMHVYLGQRYRNVPVFNGQLQVNFDDQQQVVGVNNSFVSRLADSLRSVTPERPAASAVAAAARHLGIGNAFIDAVQPPPAEDGSVTVSTRNLSLQPIVARPMLLPIRFGETRVVWNFDIHTLDRQHVYNVNVDAATDEVWTRFDRVNHDSYKVFAPTVESPIHTSPLPPNDGRTILNNPAHLLASPQGWYDGTGIMRGNNVHAYSDWTNTNTPPSSQTNCGGSMICIFPVNWSLPPQNDVAAALTNLYFWNNYIHDTQVLYGFDEVAGNFQTINYGGLGLGNDAVNAEAQDAGGTNNANFYTPADGQQPRMQMYLFTSASPNLDGDFENLVITHEYSHGISNRLVGGPSNVNCLWKAQQPGEGISDWHGLVYTHDPASTGATPRGVGTYVLNQPTTGPGIRPKRYSTDPSVNNWTYVDVAGKSIPHGVGSVFAQAMWRVYWSLIDRWGYIPDLQSPSSFGNQRAMLYMTEGLKFTACNPTFTDVRDGILQAATVNNNGEDVCRIATELARFGLGDDAVSGGPSSTTPINGFAVPPSCAVDIWAQDKPWDTGLEPDPATANDPPYESEDIWVRNDATTGPHVDPANGQVNYVHVMVRNRSSIDAHDVDVELWGTPAATSSSWPSQWTKIGTARAILVPANGATEVVIQWTPTQLGHYCLTALLLTPADPMTPALTTSPGANTRNHNDVIWKNTNVVQLFAGKRSVATFTIRNVDAREQLFTFELTQPQQQASDVLRDVVVDVRLPAELIAIMQRCGRPRGLTPLGDGTYRVGRNASFVAAIPPGRDFPVTIAFTATSGAMPGARRFRVIQRAPEGQIIGGVTYELRPGTATP